LAYEIFKQMKNDETKIITISFPFPRTSINLDLLNSVLFHVEPLNKDCVASPEVRHRFDDFCR
jgi:hypothetical protein